jgi:hypothetical protein
MCTMQQKNVVDLGDAHILSFKCLYLKRKKIMEEGHVGFVSDGDILINRACVNTKSC